MARKVFFSFKYDDVQRAMNVRNSNVITGALKSGFIDKADFEAVERSGDGAIKTWIDGQLVGTTVTVVLVGANTNKSRWVRYEIEQSIERKNGIITIDVSKIADLRGNTTNWCGMTIPGYTNYRWNRDEGRTNLGAWVERAAKDAGR
ncbi:TIR domain-containing protein [Xanthomonas sontii]|uniref:TIR domain-containing protein n=1 Tax=Xanthomonas sontii TaxID=2650745 RepID=UPI0011E4A1D0|nr:TIR domain-containing protein [Xanthomonas sontii]MDQ7760545.1 TIR domain-containing protein [Xanthomonas sontii]TYD36012.1 hypothetical protein CEK63_06500 [Xanthomonas sontii]UZK05331.1 TIR domain-containing protein [Xanthomonas sontii]